MIRVVIDSTIFVSALLQPQGLPAEVLVVALAGESVELCVSAAIYSAYEEVIRRPRFKRSENEIADALRAVRQQALWVKPSHKVRACSDPDDDVFLDCSQAAQAHFLVTGNLKHFPPSFPNRALSIDFASKCGSYVISIQALKNRAIRKPPTSSTRPRQLVQRVPHLIEAFNLAFNVGVFRFGALAYLCTGGAR